MINQWQFGALCTHERLPPADYFLVARQAGAEHGDLFSFCMCPGGLILPSNESAGLVVTNGASLSRRSGRWGNSGLVITINPEAFGNDPLQGVAYQERWERSAYEQTGGTYEVPAQRATDFLKNTPSDGTLETSYPLGARWSDIRMIIPDYVAAALQRGLPMLEKRMPGFAGGDAIITGPETRASSPVRIPRDNESRQSTSTPNLYPVGEGAGYAGGIISSAIDGVKSAYRIIEAHRPARK
jgi:hypothetical protein